MDGGQFTTAVQNIAAQLTVLASSSIDGLTTAQIVDHLDAVKQIAWALPAVEHRLTARLVADHNRWELGARTPRDVLVARLRVSKKDADRRLAEAKQLGPRQAITGQPLEPELAHTAAAIAAGLIGDEHVAVIRGFVKKLPGWVDATTREQAEKTLVEGAVTLGPDELKAVASQLALLLDQDGPEPSEQDQARKRCFTVEPQSRDGMSRVHGLVDPLGRAFLLTALAKLAAYGVTPPHTTPVSEDPEPVDNTTPGDDVSSEPSHPAGPPDTTPGPGDGGGGAGLASDLDGDSTDTDTATTECDRVPDLRSQGQRNHDALIALAKFAITRGHLGQLNGVPATIIATASLQELQAATGHAITGDGSRLPMRDVINLAANAHHYLAIFDGHTEEALYLGRARRCASTAQRLMLFARDRGCTKPGCTAPFYRSQVHHAEQDWKAGGLTDIDDLTLACQPDNNLVEKTAWTTRRRNGRTEWLPPPELDTGQARTNNYHHPQRYLTPRSDDDDPE